MQLPALPTTKPVDRLQQLLPQLFDAGERTGQAFLRFQVTPDLTMALPLSCIEETRLLSLQEIAPMPNMPTHVLGLIRMRNQVLWLTSLAKMLSLTTAIEQHDRYAAIVIRITPDRSPNADSGSDLFLGFTVHQIKGSLRLNDAAIAPLTTNIPPHLQPFLSGQVEQDNQTLFVLKPETLASLNDPHLAGLM